MKIGFDAKRLYNNFAGLGNYSRTLVDNLVKYYPENQYILYTPAIQKNFITERYIQNNQIQTHVAKAFWGSYWRSVSVVKQLQHDHIQLYHGLSHEIPVNIHKSKIKSIVTIHDLIYKIYPNTYSLADRLFFDTKYRYSCKNADRIIAVSESTKWDIVNFYKIDPLKIEVIYQSYNHLFSKPKTDHEINEILMKYNIPGEFLLSVGSVFERKNLMTLIESLACLPDNFKIPLVIVGKGKSYKIKVQERIKKLKLEDQVIWIDNMDNNDHLQCLYQKAMLFIYPSLYEGFGIPIVEAMINKTPVITSNTSSMPEAGGPNAWYVDPLNVRQIAYGIETILNDSAERARMVQESYHYACKTFDEKVISQKLVSLYENVIKE